MTQIVAILKDSYRLLTAQKLFWITLGLTVFVALLYSSIGFYDGGVSFLFGLAKWDLSINVSDNFQKFLYMWIFTDFLVPKWIGIFSLFLALLSVAPLFPKFMQKGAIDIAVSKPVHRATLFFTKYVGCLLFIGAQITVFCVICFIAQGVRIGVWNFQIFWGIVFILISFSSIFCVSAFISVVSRSTIFSLLVALIMWGIGSVANLAEEGLYRHSHNPVYELLAESDPSVNKELDLEIYRLASVISTPFPKIKRMSTALKDTVEVEELNTDGVNGEEMSIMEVFIMSLIGAFQSEEETFNVRDRHSMTYLVGWTLGYNAFFLGLGAFFFCRKDF